MQRAILLAIFCFPAFLAGCDRNSGEKEIPRLARQQTDPQEGAFRNLGKRGASSVEAGAVHGEPLSR